MLSGQAQAARTAGLRAAMGQLEVALRLQGMAQPKLGGQRQAGAPRRVMLSRWAAMLRGGPRTPVCIRTAPWSESGVTVAEESAYVIREEAVAGVSPMDLVRIRGSEETGQIAQEQVAEAGEAGSIPLRPARGFPTAAAAARPRPGRLRRQRAEGQKGSRALVRPGRWGPEARPRPVLPASAGSTRWGLCPRGWP